MGRKSRGIPHDHMAGHFCYRCRQWWGGHRGEYHAPMDVGSEGWTERDRDRVHQAKLQLSDIRTQVRHYPSIQEGYATKAERNVQVESDPQVSAARERVEAALRLAVKNAKRG